ncbi:MAG: sulfatase-like hydrolase/transferase [Spirochaetaceae bacterium]|nr:sulfatase-like hydrolase/transferase [Spirochaetaceae bacterium]
MSDRNGGRPNILVLMTDEHAAQFAGTYGHPFIATPGMDRLACEGVTFDAAYCNNPLCVPSRLSFMTGRYTHRCGGWDNSTALPVDAVTWPYLLRAQGYEAVLSGKMHLIGPDRLHGFERQLAVDLHADLVHPVYRWAEGVPEAAEPWSGVTRTGSRVPEHGRRFGAEVDADAPMEQPVETGPGTTPEIEADDLAVERAIEFLHTREGADAPFALCVGLIAPHYPFVVPEPFFSQYFPEHADLPELPPGHPQELSPASQRLRRAFGFHGHTDDQVRRARAAYYGLVSYADSKLEALLDVLDRTGLADNTIVVHTSDHGELLGEHGLWRKMSFYEQSARVPLQIRWPGRGVAGERIPACTSLVDVTATLVDAAGAAGPGLELDGRSLAGLIDGSAEAIRAWPDEAFAEHTAHGTDRPRAMLRRGRWKLCLSGGDDPEAELYDLLQDPGEFHNRAGDPDVADIETEMRDALLARWDPDAVDAQVRAHQDRVALIRSASRPGERPLF